jgi:acetyl-CoA acetyltransferase
MMIDEQAMRDATCFVGVGNSRYGSFPETDDYGLGVEALKAALDDAGLALSDIDGLIVGRIRSYETFSEMIGLNKQTLNLQLNSAGRFSAVSVMQAAQALVTGQARCIALVYGNNGRSVRDTYGGAPGLYAPWGFTSPGARHALMARRHMELYGTTSEHFGHVSMTFRQHASLNPNAVKREPFTIEEHQASRFIAEPLHLLDYCQINDGAVALIMTTADRAKDLRKPPAYISGFARADDYSRASIYPEDLWYDPLQQVASRVYRNAGIERDAIDGLMIYDNFSPTVLFALEGMGFCPRGEGGPFVADGNLALGARLPTNTSGGHLSESYMQGWALIGEAVRQVRGECGDRQIEDCSAVQYICATSICSSIIVRR